MLRFRLKWLLVTLGLIAASLALLTQISKRIATFEIISNDLTLAPDGLISGQLQCIYSGPEATNRDFIFEVIKIDQPELLNLKRGKDFRIRFQYQPYWPIEKENQFLSFIANGLNIQQEYVEGFVMTPSETRVMLRGR
jgi:hypothetical protein